MKMVSPSGTHTNRQWMNETERHPVTRKKTKLDCCQSLKPLPCSRFLYLICIQIFGQQKFHRSCIVCVCVCRFNVLNVKLIKFNVFSSFWAIGTAGAQLLFHVKFKIYPKLSILYHVSCFVAYQINKPSVFTRLSFFILLSGLAFKFEFNGQHLSSCIKKKVKASLEKKRKIEVSLLSTSKWSLSTA